jgi:hypothetical protein
MNTARDKAAREYAQSIMSDGYAVGRSEAQKLIEGVMVSNAHNAGWDAAIARVLEMVEKSKLFHENECGIGAGYWIRVSHIEELCGGGHEK